MHVLYFIWLAILYQVVLKFAISILDEEVGVLLDARVNVEEHAVVEECVEWIRAVLVWNEHRVHEPEAHYQLAHIFVNHILRLADDLCRVGSVYAFQQFYIQVGEVGAIEISSNGPIIFENAIVIFNVEL